MLRVFLPMLQGSLPRESGWLTESWGAFKCWDRSFDRFDPGLHQKPRALSPLGGSFGQT